MLIGGIFKVLISGFFLYLDGIIYNFVRWFYRIFLFLAQLNLFDTDDYISIVNRIYIIIGVVMLFVLAYSLLKAVINPDEFAKGEASFPNLIKNVVISLIIIVLLPTVFDVAYRMQNAVLQHDVIGKIILGENYHQGDNDLVDGGNLIAAKTFSAFLYPTEEGSDITSNTFFFGGGDLTFEDALVAVEEDEASFLIFTNFSQAVDDGDITYNFIASTLAGIFLLWCILLFCFDLGTRVVKLIFYQTIAPIAVICRILPEGKAKSVFSNWLKLTLGTFAEVFIRVAVMYLGVWLIKLIVMKFDSISVNVDVQRGLVLAFLIMGVVAFMRQAPKLIQDLFGLEMGGLNLGLKGLTSRLADGGALTAASAIGGGATAMVRNAYVAKRDERSVLASGLGGLGSGFARGLKAGAGAQNFGDMRNAASTAATKATDARIRRNARRARYGKNGPVIGHLGDMATGIHNWATGGSSQFKEIIETGQEFKKANDAIHDETEKLMNKVKNNAELVATMQQDDFKGDIESVRRMYGLYQSYDGQSLATIEADIERQKKVTDFSEFVDKNTYIRTVTDLLTGTTRQEFDADGYQAAIDERAREHAQRIADLDSMYNQLWKASKFELIDSAMELTTKAASGDPDALEAKYAGLDIAKLNAISGKVDEFKVMYSAKGNHVHDNVTGEDKGAIPTSGKIGKAIDDVATVYSNNANKASGEAARIRQAEARRKDNNS